ncbi:hypothetical protein [Microscilla marina]|nr:hypothetical protein [Microscilla marina]
MNWNTIYRIYEVLAICLVVICVGLMAFTPPFAYQTTFNILQTTLNEDIKDSKAYLITAIKNLKAEVAKFGNGRDGLSRLKRAKLVQSTTQKVMQALYQIEKNNHQPQIVKQQVYQVMNAHVKWLNKEYEDLDKPHFTLPFDFPLKTPTLGQWVTHFFDTTTSASLKAWLAQQRLSLLHYQSQVLYFLGAFYPNIDISEAFPFNLAPSPITVTAPTSWVRVGDTYTADMFWITHWHYASLITKMYYNNKITGDGAVRFEVPPRGKQYWEAKFRYYTVDGKKDTTIVQKVYYEVK